MRLAAKRATEPEPLDGRGPRIPARNCSRSRASLSDWGGWDRGAGGQEIVRRSRTVGTLPGCGRRGQIERRAVWAPRAVRCVRTRRWVGGNFGVRPVFLARASSPIFVLGNDPVLDLLAGGRQESGLELARTATRPAAEDGHDERDDGRQHAHDRNPTPDGKDSHSLLSAILDRGIRKSRNLGRTVPIGIVRPHPST